MDRQRVEAYRSHAPSRLPFDDGHCRGPMPCGFAIAVGCSPLYNRSPIESQVECGVSSGGKSRRDPRQDRERWQALIENQTFTQPA